MNTSTSNNANNLELKDLLKLVQQLPKVYRSVFNLYAVEGYSHQEIGNTLGISELLSRTTLYRARNILKEKLAQLTSNEQYYMAG
jgi:RNA polymerase sigma-70 factor (ECF subfamily)